MHAITFYRLLLFECEFYRRVIYARKRLNFLDSIINTRQPAGLDLVGRHQPPERVDYNCQDRVSVVALSYYRNECLRMDYSPNVLSENVCV